MRLKELAEKTSDVFHLSRRHIVIREGFNVRIDYKESEEKWQAFVASIVENGIIKPLQGFKDENDKFNVTDGHRRITGLDEAITILQTRLAEAKAGKNRAAVTQLREQIETISVVPCTSEKMGYTDLDRNFDMAIGNTGKEFNLLELSTLFMRLMKEFSVSESEILRRTGKSQTTFDNCMLLGNAPETHPFIRSGQVTPSLAIELIRKVKDRDTRIKLLEEAIAAAEAAGKSHATAKHLNETARSVVAPSKKGQAAKAASGSTSTPAEPPAETGGQHRFNAITGAAAAAAPAPAGSSAPAAREAATASLESVLGNRAVVNLSGVMDAKWKIEGLITLALSRRNQTWFYDITLRQGKKEEIAPIGWRFCTFNPGAVVNPPDAATPGFDDKEIATLQAWREIRSWLSRNPARFTTEALAACDKAIAALSDEDEQPAGSSASTGGGFTLDAPPAPSADDHHLSTDLGDQVPEDSDGAFDGILRVYGDVSGITGVARKNERYATLGFIAEYLEGKHTHNQLKAFVLYGSPETRDLTASQR